MTLNFDIEVLELSKNDFKPNEKYLRGNFSKFLFRGLANLGLGQKVQKMSKILKSLEMISHNRYRGINLFQNYNRHSLNGRASLPRERQGEP